MHTHVYVYMLFDRNKHSFLQSPGPGTGAETFCLERNPLQWASRLGLQACILKLRRDGDPQAPNRRSLYPAWDSSPNSFMRDLELEALKEAQP